jgi:hypothetical protein
MMAAIFWKLVTPIGKHMLIAQPLPQDKGVLCTDGNNESEAHGKAGYID